MLSPVLLLLYCSSYASNFSKGSHAIPISPSQLSGTNVQVLHILFAVCRCAAPVQDPPVLEYMRESNRGTYDINLEASLQPEGGREPSVIAKSNLKHL